MIMIETTRLLLREMGPEDFDALYAVLADSDIMQHYPYTFDEARVRNWINKTSSGTACSASVSGRSACNLRAR